jgi:hypothetical protein
VVLLRYSRVCNRPLACHFESELRTWVLLSFLSRDAPLDCRNVDGRCDRLQESRAAAFPDPGDMIDRGKRQARAAFSIRIKPGPRVNLLLQTRRLDRNRYSRGTAAQRSNIASCCHTVSLRCFVDHRVCVPLHNLRVLSLRERKEFLTFESGLRTHEIFESGRGKDEDCVYRISADVGHGDPCICWDKYRGAAMYFPHPIAQAHLCSPILQEENFIRSRVSVANYLSSGW